MINGDYIEFMYTIEQLNVCNETLSNALQKWMNSPLNLKQRENGYQRMTIIGSIYSFRCRKLN